MTENSKIKFRTRGDYMQRTKLFLSSLFLTAALVAPLAIRVTAAPQAVSVRVYDRDHKDYHNWDDREAQSYTTFRVDHPKYNVTFSKTSRSQQSAYWNWRHDHPDAR
jgi:hypothetical protein